ncbi:hypothetical protein ACGFNX_32235 [Streptomyces sp. NPDC048723]|uniref:hypothetical protein n=1 Tax=Streptomyces sp. NPDC048723 TaxID=3365589 RepID=UPI00371D0C33
MARLSVDRGGPPGGTAPAPGPLHRTVFPAPVRFSGMPLPRWWAVEDGKTHFAAVRPDSTDLARLICLEFALVYSNDWYRLPCDLPAGTPASVYGLSVTDVFGEQQWIEPAGSGPGGDRDRWSMFALAPVGGDRTGARPALLLPPGASKIADGPVLEEVLLVRDEQANLVWGLERTARTTTGEPRRGASSPRRAWRTGRAWTRSPRGRIRARRSRTRRGTPCPRTGSPSSRSALERGRSVRLRRAAMPHPVDGRAVEPRTELLRHGLDPVAPDRRQASYVNEEEVPQAGSRLTIAYDRTRTRGRDGQVIVWLSARRGAGRGEAANGLAFDHLVNISGA